MVGRLVDTNRFRPLVRLCRKEHQDRAICFLRYLVLSSGGCSCGGSSMSVSISVELLIYLLSGQEKDMAALNRMV